MYREMMDNTQKSKIKGQIDANLKRIYDQTLQEDIPDRLTALLDRLRQKAEAEPDQAGSSEAGPDGAQS